MSSITLAKAVPGAVFDLDRKTQVRVFVLALFLVDAVNLGLAFLLAYGIRFRSGLPFFDDALTSSDYHVWMTVALIPIWLGLYLVFGLYDSHYLFGSTQEYQKVFSASSVAFTLVVVGTFLVPAVRVSRGWIVIAWLTAIVLGGLGRFAFRRAADYLRGRGLLTAQALIVGADEEALAMAQQFQSVVRCGLTPVGFVDDRLVPGTEVMPGLPALGSVASLPILVRERQIEELVISNTALSREQVLWIFQTFGNSDQVELRFSPGLFEIYTSGVRVKEIGSVPLVSMRKARLDGIETAIKLFVDYALASIALLLFMPVFVMIGILIKWDSPGPAVYRRRVIGRGGRTFDAFKFRTMYSNSDEILKQHPELQAELQANQKLKDDPRVTRIGQFLRKYSIDELPQLLNVLLGQMSLVGPRMISPPELDKYGKWRLNLCTLRPGLTGLWQISGRSDLSYTERVRLDMFYIRNYTSWIDFYILFQTVAVVLRGKGAY